MCTYFQVFAFKNSIYLTKIIIYIVLNNTLEKLENITFKSKKVYIFISILNFIIINIYNGP